MVATKIGEMAAVEPNLQASELAKVTCRSLVMFSDDDLVTLAHAVEMYDALPNAELAVVPDLALPDPGEARAGERAGGRLPDQGAGADGRADSPRAQARDQSRLAATADPRFTPSL